jgi:hypothetical protein
MNWRGGSPNKPCEEHEKLKLVAEDLLANIDDSTSPKQFAEAQKSILFYWQELKKRLDPLHPRFPGGHLCLDDAYLHYAMVLRARAIAHKPLPPPAPPAPPNPQPLSDDELMERLKEYVKESTKETFFGQDQEAEEAEEEEEEESA